MKLFRSDLKKLISNQLFEISTNDLDLNGLNIADNKLHCTISVEVATDGYRIHGNLETNIESSCDRCLTKFHETRVSNINIILSNDNDLINDTNIDVVQFSDSD
ncbi:MAG: hypothetical protein HOG33_07835, partial [Candidatus Marinimicrobia bacterium]|nr:hypothetical protein [Candidatus Neomarinimicrobiota bacterium]